MWYQSGASSSSSSIRLVNSWSFPISLIRTFHRAETEPVRCLHIRPG